MEKKKDTSIGLGWVKITEGDGGEPLIYMNSSLNKKAIIGVLEDEHGCIRVKFVPIRKPKGNNATHIIYPDKFYYDNEKSKKL